MTLCGSGSSADLLDILGKPIRLGLDAYTIVAVAPRGFAGIGFKAADIWLPLAPRGQRTTARSGIRWVYDLRMIARTRPGVSRDRVNEQATSIYRAAHPQQVSGAKTVVQPASRTCPRSEDRNAN